jgi:uncharacterized protein YbjT (DUF2867 family)
MPPKTPSAGRTVLVVGATGLVGTEVVQQLLSDETVARVVLVVRRPLTIASPKAEVHVVDFEKLADHKALFAVDQIICALGTTIKHAGSQAAFRKVDFEYPLTIARLGRNQGVRHFLLVSALGADSESGVFYNRVKGELEDQLRSLGYRAVTVARPSLLLGARKEFRLMERIGMVIGEFVPGRYRPVKAEAVARSLVTAARIDAPGLHIIESEEIRTGVDPSRAGEEP